MAVNFQKRRSDLMHEKKDYEKEKEVIEEPRVTTYDREELEVDTAFTVLPSVPD